MTSCGPSAPGFDALLFDEFLWLPHVVFVHFCKILTLIEQGAPWPQHLLHAKAHMLSKDATRPFDSLAYRLLLTTPVVYRGWAKLRLRHLQPWVASWCLPRMFGCIQGIGASEAWYATSVDVEWAMAFHVPIIGGALDLYRCFDQVLRPLLYAVLLLAGIPEQVLTAYITHQESMLIYNTVHGSI